MNTDYRLCGNVTVSPIWWDELPEVSVFLGENKLFHDKISKDKVINFDVILPKGKNNLSVSFHNKKDSDTRLEEQKDKVIVVKSIEFFGIQSNRFIWEGKYYPEYPSHMTDQPNVLSSHNYLSWNGTWVLEFTLPIFMWIHNVESMGWIYE